MKNPSALPLTKEEIKLALSQGSTSSAPVPEGISSSVGKMINLINLTIILELLSARVGFGCHRPSPKTANRVVLYKSGKASYDCLASFSMIFLLKTISNIRERVMTVKLSAIA